MLNVVLKVNLFFIKNHKLTFNGRCHRIHRKSMMFLQIEILYRKMIIQTVKMQEVKRLNDGQEEILNYIKKYIKEDQEEACNVMIFGVAGTGKSFLINEIKTLLKENDKKCIIGSHQAISASIINGLTLYKIFGFSALRTVSKITKNGVKYIINKELSGFSIKKRMKDMFLQEEKNFDKDRKKNWLIIDEISMIGLEFLDDMNEVLKELFDNNLVFGGINLIFSGHLSQLKPVKETPIFELTRDHFIKYFKLFELEKNQRQQDEKFFNLCNGVMRGCLKSEQKRILKSRLIKNFKYSELENLVHIFPTKNLCSKHNYKRLFDLDQIEYYFVKSEDEGNACLLSREENNCFNGLFRYSVFCKNSKIMTTVNTDNVLNGEIYYIRDIDLTKEIYINEFFKDLDNQREEIEYLRRELVKKNKKIIFTTSKFINISVNKSEIIDDNKNYDFHLPQEKKIIEIIKYDEEKKKSVKVMAFSRTMLPFQLSWAVTTHKIQGISLDEGVVDMGDSNFDPVQLYVNISRLRSLDKLYIIDLKLPLPVPPNKKKIENFINIIKNNNIENKKYIDDVDEE